MSERTEYIAYQTVDSEGDIWSNDALLFENEESVKSFFSNPQLVIETLGFEVEEDEDIDNCIVLLEHAGYINGVIITLEYCGKCKILRMNSGYLIK